MDAVKLRQIFEKLEDLHVIFLREATQHEARYYFKFLSQQS